MSGVGYILEFTTDKVKAISWSCHLCMGGKAKLESSPVRDTLGIKSAY